MVSLNRRTSAQTPGGLYCCVVPTDDGTHTACIVGECKLKFWGLMHLLVLNFTINDIDDSFFMGNKFLKVAIKFCSLRCIIEKKLIPQIFVTLRLVCQIFAAVTTGQSESSSQSVSDHVGVLVGSVVAVVAVIVVIVDVVLTTLYMRSRRHKLPRREDIRNG